MNKNMIILYPDELNITAAVCHSLNEIAKLLHSESICQDMLDMYFPPLVHLLLKKPLLVPTILVNFDPVSNLHF